MDEPVSADEELRIGPMWRYPSAIAGLDDHCAKDWRYLTMRLRVLMTVLVVALAVVAIVVRFTPHGGGPPIRALTPHDGGPPIRVGDDGPSAGTPICGQPILDSPWNYNGAPGTYTTSGKPAGLPTFSAAGTDFPHATSVLVVAAGDNTSAGDSGAYQVNNTVVYFEPGIHTIQDGMYTGHNSAYVGGYTVAVGKAIIDGVNGATTTGNGGAYLSLSKPSANSLVNNTWEYLTIKNYTSSQNNSVMGNINGGGSDEGDVYKYDTIGPNEYGYSGSSTPPRTGKSNGGGYAIDLGSHTTVEYDCLTRDAQGAFNGGGVDDVISSNEISWNGLGEYPDSAGAGGSPYSCGCSGGGKLFYSVNADVVNNWVHNNYNVGIWFDFDNTGALISHNYVAFNWGEGIEYEASYNADISDNTLVGNGWASDGPWPTGVGGGRCFGNVSCTNGEGPITGAGGGFPYAAIYLPNSGGNSSLRTIFVPSTIAVPNCSTNCTVRSRYPGELLVQGNMLMDNFGGVVVYTDTNRYPGNIDADSACSVPLGALDQPNSSIYYQQTKVLTTNADAAISGSSVTSTGGTTTLCDNYGASGGSGGSGGQQGGAVEAPSVGMAVYDLKSGAFLGKVASVTSATAFTLSDSPGDESGASLLLSAYGGCGPADYFGGSLGVSSGAPADRYWDNCIWGSRNVTVSGNTFALDARAVTGCTVSAMCGVMAAISFNAGVPPLMQFFDSYQKYIANASSGLGNVWSGNVYTWTGGGPGGWRFQAGAQGTAVNRTQWQASPYDQDVGSSFS
jgi:hypothetical protein